jgi:hypothetical protein
MADQRDRQLQRRRWRTIQHLIHDRADLRVTVQNGAVDDIDDSGKENQKDLSRSVEEIVVIAVAGYFLHSLGLAITLALSLAALGCFLLQAPVWCGTETRVGEQFSHRGVPVNRDCPYLPGSPIQSALALETVRSRRSYPAVFGRFARRSGPPEKATDIWRCCDSPEFIEGRIYLAGMASPPPRLTLVQHARSHGASREII